MSTYKCMFLVKQLIRANKYLNKTNKRKRKSTLTCTFGPGDQRWPWWSFSSLARPGQDDFDLILHIWVQVPQFIGGRVHCKDLTPVPWSGAVCHLFRDYRPITNDAVGIGFNPEVCGSHVEQLRWCNWGGWSCEWERWQMENTYFMLWG